jgi:hypothetical protein
MPIAYSPIHFLGHLQKPYKTRTGGTGSTRQLTERVLVELYPEFRSGKEKERKQVKMSFNPKPDLCPGGSRKALYFLPSISADVRRMYVHMCPMPMCFLFSFLLIDCQLIGADLH